MDALRISFLEGNFKSTADAIANTIISTSDPRVDALSLQNINELIKQNSQSALNKDFKAAAIQAIVPTITKVEPNVPLQRPHLPKSHQSGSHYRLGTSSYLLGASTAVHLRGRVPFLALWAALHDHRAQNRA
jgi:hypothetical protein